VSILNEYLQLRYNTESPLLFHRWSFLACTAAALRRNLWMAHGKKKIHPACYVSLIGSPGTRKSSAIGGARELLERSGFKDFSSSRTSKQQFLQDMQGKMLQDDDLDGRRPHCSFIAEDEFIDFLGIGNIEFVGLLTNLWDCKQEYDEVYKRSRAYIYQPTINILGGMTQTSLALALPSESGGMGFLSRMLLVYGEQRRVRIAFPEVPTEEDEAPFVRFFKECSEWAPGEVRMHSSARDLVTDWYNTWEPLMDARLLSYCQRRQEHLFRLCMVLCGVHRKDYVDADIVLEANTYLVHAEERMHKAFGEQGKSRYAEASAKITAFMEQSNRPVSMEELYKVVHTDLDRYGDLLQVLQNLEHGERIYKMNGHFLLRSVKTADRRKYTDFKRFIMESDEYERDEKHQREAAEAVRRVQSAVSGSGVL